MDTAPRPRWTPTLAYDSTRDMPRLTALAELRSALAMLEARNTALRCGVINEAGARIRAALALLGSKPDAT
ncbi:MAG: hypothetical protein EBR82_31945 [Caulobacteraceae bacterium]|nr:hypothetical protein [Caulobacteraceae bacterium]